MAGSGKHGFLPNALLSLSVSERIRWRILLSVRHPTPLFPWVKRPLREKRRIRTLRSICHEGGSMMGLWSDRAPADRGMRLGH
jgi:hypothetical protein